MAQSPGFSEYCPYEPPIALWELVENYVPPHERQEIRKMLGESLVGQSLELHEEVNTLLEIWRDYRDETEDFLTRNRLPEPPAARERLKQEIKFFVNSIREKARDNGTDATQVLQKHNSDVLDYALDTERTSSSGYESRPSTAVSSSRDGRETPLVRVTPTNERLSTLSDEVVAINDKLTYLKVDEVVSHLRDTLEEEVTQLMSDIEFLQGCLDNEADLRTNSRCGSREPTLTDLREERSKLEKDLLKDVTAITPAFKLSATKRDSHYRPMPPSITPKSSSSSGKPVLSSISSQTKRTSPVKALHNISPVQTHKASSCSSHTKTTTTNPSQNSHADHCTASTSSTGQAPAERSNRARVKSYKFQPGDVNHVIVKTRSPDQVTVGGNCKQEVIPSPPSSAKPSRPSSAQRFRRMVIESRDNH